MSRPKHTALIIEDEPHARQRLRQLLKAHEEIEIVGEANNGKQGARLIGEHRPDVVFLDIQMPLLNGFEMLGGLEYMPRIIFTTAYEEFALSAFEHNSIDYLLKPFSADRLAKAIQKLERLSQGVDMNRLQDVMQGISQKRSGTITVSMGGRVYVVSYADIIYLRADQKCIEIHDVQNRKFLLYTSLQKLIEKLPASFLHVHRAYIINRDYIHAIRKGFRGQLIFEMNDPAQTLISTGKTYVKGVKEALGMGME
jgi:two-component system LytT family response regulator